MPVLLERSTIRPMLAVVVTVTIGFFFNQAIRADQREQLEREIAAFEMVFATQLEERLASRLDVAALMSDAIESRTGEAKEIFAALAPTLHARHDDIQALNWIGPDGVIRIVTPFEENRAALGLDITSLPVPARALRTALEERKLKVTPPIDLAQGGRGFVAYQPVFDGDRLLGYVNVVFRAAPLIDDIANEFDDGRVHIAIFDGGEAVWRGADPVESTAVSRIQSISVGGRNWTLVATPTSAGTATAASILDELVLALSVIVAIALALAIREAERNRAMLIDREERFDLAMSGASDGLFDYNAETGETYYSPRWFQMLGYEPGELEPGLETFLSLLHPQDEPRMRRERIETAPSGAVAEDEFRMRHKDGSWVHIMSRATVLRDGETVKRIVGTHVDITELRQQQKELEVAARTDELTGLRNRRGLREDLSAHAETLRADDRIAVLHVDLDMFKSVNDMLGHEAGDFALKTVADRLRADAAGYDMLARVGGDEFILAKRISVGNDELVRIADETISRISVPIDYGANTCSVGASIGISFLLEELDASVNEAISNADIALAAAKKLGRGRSQIFSDGMQEETVYAAALSMEIEDALRSEEFVAHYQPQFELATEAVVGFEALARWYHPTRGILTGGAFVPYAESSNLIAEIDDRILRQACRLARRLPELGVPDASISVNMSTRQLMDPEFVSRFVRTAQENGADLSQLRVEILESTLLSERTENVAESIRRLAEFGIRLDLDDFGTGHAAISSLLNFPISRVKLDRSLVTNIDDDPRRQAIVHAIVDMSNSLSVEILAEGIENEAELCFLRDIGCLYAQGYHLARPLPLDELQALLPSGQLRRTA